MSPKTEQYLERVNQAIADAPDVLADLRAQRDSLDAKIKQVEAFMKVMGAPIDKPKVRRRRKPDPDPTFSETDQAVINAIAAMHRDQFTVRDLCEILPSVTSAQMYTSFNKLRDIQVIGKMGKRGGAQLWRVIDEAVMTGIAG